VKKLFLILGILAASALSTNAAVVGLFNTGVNGSGGLLTFPNMDPHYVLTGPAGCCTGARVVNPATYPAGNGTWVTDASSPASQWIGPVDNFDPSGAYGFSGLFNYDLAITAAGGETITGRWSADNDACIVLNGGSPTNCIGSAVFNTWTPFTITGFTGGANTLHFQVNNISGPTGLRVEFAPEPNSLMLLLPGLAGFALLLRRRS
jgi:hypothetical protein